jgi:class 3 adenylate cyclase
MEFLRRLSNAGTAGLDLKEAKHVRLANQLSLLAMFMSVLAFSDPRVWATRVLLGVAAASVLIYATVPLLARLGQQRLARNVLWLGSLAWISTDGVLMGTDAEQHLLLMAVAMGSWFVMPRRERRDAFIASLVCGVAIFAIDLGPARAAMPSTFPMDTVDKMTLFVALLGLAYYAVTQTERAEDELAAEQAKSEALLLNVLPRSIAERLKKQERSIAERYDEATVLFADLVNFTQLSERVSATALVQMLDQVFTRFDALADKHGLEKIKTIGDAYMVVGGLPAARADHAAAVASMGLDMLEVLQQLEGDSFRGLNIRIGIHSGPVVAGVIGMRKFAFDLWGDTVNTASRMESHGQPGRVHVSEAVFKALQQQFVFEARGAITVKGKGELNTWFLTGRSSS